MQIEISANKRVLQGTGASRRLRGSGKVPGIIYGGENPAQPIELDHNNLFHQLKLEAFHASILSMEMEGQKEPVLLRDIQMHPFKSQVLHIDFQRVDPEQENTHESALALHQRGYCARGETFRRPRQPCAYRTGCFLSAEGSARVYSRSIWLISLLATPCT